MGPELLFTSDVFQLSKSTSLLKSSLDDEMLEEASVVDKSIPKSSDLTQIEMITLSFGLTEMAKHEKTTKIKSYF
jgi:hypothetical protein